MRTTSVALALAALTVSAAGMAQIAAPPAPPAVVLPVAAVPEKVICKSSIETGSLIKRHKQCFTAKQWHYVDDQHEREARKLVEDGTGKQRGD